MFDGRPEETVSVAEACNRICKLAGLDHRVVDVPPSDDPELVRVFGPDPGGDRRQGRQHPDQSSRSRESKTYKRLGYDPISLDEGFGTTTAWLRELGKVS